MRPWLLVAAVLAALTVGAALADEPGDDDQEIFIQVEDEDAGPVDAGVRDAGVDAGVVDAGPRFVDHWDWMADGGHFPSGATDRVEVRVGHWVEVNFYRAAIETVCDDRANPIIGVLGTQTGIRFTGLDAGHTQCGFWLGVPQPYPDRLVDVDVVPANR